MNKVIKYTIITLITMIVIVGISITVLIFKINKPDLQISSNNIKSVEKNENSIDERIIIAINYLKEILKNPESLQINGIIVTDFDLLYNNYKDLLGDDFKLSYGETIQLFYGDDIDLLGEKVDYLSGNIDYLVHIDYSAMNGFGGYNRSYCHLWFEDGKLKGAINLDDDMAYSKYKEIAVQDGEDFCFKIVNINQIDY